MPIQNWSDDVAIAQLADDPQLGDDLKAIEELVSRKPTGVVLDFTGVGYVNSSNIARLLRLRQLAITGDTRLVLCGLGRQVWSTFQVTGLDKIFDVTDNVTLALATLQIA
jgi:anti-anti-sigma factor